MSRARVASCYACGATGRSPYATENGFSLVKCNDCGLLYVVDPPALESIAAATREGRHHGEEADLDVTGRFNPSAVPRYHEPLAALFGPELATKHSWLDVGCGHGEFITALGQVTAGRLAVRGVEPNVHKVASSRARGLDVSAFDISTHPGRYDVVSMLDVYSHLPDPPAFLATLKGLLDPAGELVIQTGDAADLEAKDQLRPFGLPNHLSFASETILRSMLGRLGFSVVSVWKGSYLRRDPVSVAKEVVKFFVPGYRSRIRHHLDWERSSRTNMFIRAKLAD